MKNLYIVLGLVFISQFAFGQEFPLCGQELREQFVKSTQYEKYTNYKAPETDSISGTVYIPVVVHIIYKTASQNIDDSLVFSQIEVLNRDFQMTNADTSKIRNEFKGVKGNPQVSFCLAIYDPDGNPTNGITRTETTKNNFVTFSNTMMVSAIGGKDAWPTDKYLNIWVVNLVNSQGQGQTGYAIFPWDATPKYDGVVINYRNFGANNGDQIYSDGRIGTHEVGHFFGLSHNFKGGCGGGAPTNCAIAGDSICDTPPQTTWIQACQPGMVSCGNKLAQWENFMDYSIAGCMVMFTYDQAEKVRMNINKWGFRKSLTISSACGLSSVDNILMNGSVKIYPNPANSIIHVDVSNNALLAIQIFDIRGVRIKEVSTAGLANQIDISSLKQGVYILHIVSSTGEKSNYRLIKQ